MTPIVFFKYLQGKWRIDREVSNYGRLIGEAELIPIDVDSLRYREDLILESSHEKWHREYIYAYEDGNIIKYFSDGRLFYPLEFKMGNGISIIGEHLCDCDLYKAVYHIKNENAFSLEYTVDGPNKSYKIVTKFIRV